MWEKVPQLNHLDTWPATVFVGRDGKVKAVHSGFASPASGEFHTQLKEEFTTPHRKAAGRKTGDQCRPTQEAGDSAVENVKRPGENLPGRCGALAGSI